MSLRFPRLQSVDSDAIKAGFSLDDFACSSYGVHFVAGQERAVNAALTRWQDTQDSLTCITLSAKKFEGCDQLISVMRESCAVDYGGEQHQMDRYCFIVQDAGQLCLDCILGLMAESDRGALKVILLLTLEHGQALKKLMHQQPLITTYELPDIQETMSVVMETLEQSNFARYQKDHPLGLPPLRTIYQIHHDCHGDKALIRSQLREWLINHAGITTMNGQRTRGRNAGFWLNKRLHQGVGLAVMAGLTLGFWQHEKQHLSSTMIVAPRIVAVSTQPATAASPRAGQTTGGAKFYTIAVTRNANTTELQRLEKRYHISQNQATLRTISLPGHSKTYELDVGHYPTRHAAQQAMQRLHIASHNVQSHHS